VSYEPQGRPSDPIALAAHRPGPTGMSATTLGIASAASALAAFVVHHLWGPGTVLSAAVTPVIVALTSEFLRRPAARVSSLQEIGAARLTPSRERVSGGPSRAQAGADRSVRYAGGREDGPPPPSRSEYSVRRARFGAAGPARADRGDRAGTPAPAYRHLRPRRPWWRPALITGLVAFALVAVIFTVSDLAVGHSVTGGGHATTLFGFGARSSPSATPKSTDRSTSTGKPASKAPATKPPKATTAPGSAAPGVGSSIPGSSSRQTTTPAPSTPPAPPGARSGTPSSHSSTPPPSPPAGSRSQAPGAPAKP